MYVMKEGAEGKKLSERLSTQTTTSRDAVSGSWFALPVSVKRKRWTDVGLESGKGRSADRLCRGQKRWSSV